jgi:multicomponent Na+:H+ antiporter subunit B
MTARARQYLFFAAAAVMAVMFAWGFRDLPPLGDYRGPYGYVVNQVAVYERHATDVVNAISYDYRGFDTMGEEFILFASVMGVLLLFRPSPNSEKESGSENEEMPEQLQREDSLPVSNALRIGMHGMVGVTLVFGLYIATHGQLTPGGGFQGGVILATVPLLVYLSGSARAFQRIVNAPLVKLGECGGAAAYVVLGFLGMWSGAHFLTNVVPLGKTGDVFSSGTIALISVAVGMEVAGGFVLMMKTYLEEVILRRRAGKS